MCEGSEGLTVRKSGPDWSRVSWWWWWGGVTGTHPLPAKVPQLFFSVPHLLEVPRKTPIVESFGVSHQLPRTTQGRYATIYGFPGLTSLPLSMWHVERTSGLVSCKPSTVICVDVHRLFWDTTESAVSARGHRGLFIARGGAAL